MHGVPNSERPARPWRRSQATRSTPGLRGSAAHLPRTSTEATRATAPLPAASRSRPIPHALCVPAASGRPPRPARRHPSRRARPRGFPPERRRARGRPGARGSGRGGRQARATVLGQTAGHAARAGRERALTGEVMRRTAPRSSPDGHSASEPSPSLRTATQPPSRRHRSPVGFPASCGGAAPSLVRVRGAAGAPGIGGPDCGRPSAPGGEPPYPDLSADPPPSRLRVPGAGEDVWEKNDSSLARNTIQ